MDTVVNRRLSPEGGASMHQDMVSVLRQVLKEELAPTNERLERLERDLATLKQDVAVLKEDIAY